MSIPRFPASDDPAIQDALEQAEELEFGGTILNDHYSRKFYTERRAKFLAVCPGYANLLTGLFTIAGDDAYTIFGDHRGDLSVQEIRRREIQLEIMPFLPLPTIRNTDTLDNYGGLPNSEWTEGKSGVWTVLTPTPSPPPMPAPSPDDAPTKDDFAAASDTDDDESGEQADDDDDDLSLPRPLGKRVRFAQQTALDGAEKSGAAQQGSASNVVTGIVNHLDRLDPSSASSASGVIPHASAAARSAGASTGSQALPTEAKRGVKRAASDGARESAASYANRPTKRRVKVRRGTKLPAGINEEDIEFVSTDSEAGNDSAASSDEAEPPRKKVKINVGPKPSSAKRPPKPVDSRASSEAPRKAPRKKPAPKTQPKKKKTAVASSSTKNRSGPTLAAVVSGTALPRSRDQAREADEERYAQLVSAHNAARRSGKKKTQEEPELMPEYFQTANFPDDAKEDQVRCVCGVVADDGQSMICCDSDGCSAWQHVACVGDAAPKDLAGGGYHCHNCDPWAHRKVIQGLRKARSSALEE